jgi:hypothetical protein
LGAAIVAAVEPTPEKFAEVPITPERFAERAELRGRFGFECAPLFGVSKH